ncbi:MAG TPA: hypothetical protein VK809_09575, partial [Bacteroidia bacterium]|nr:hypothetical protein [Bacteroidia bacterium]
MKKQLFSNMKGALLSFIFIFSFSLCEGQSWVWGVTPKEIGGSSGGDGVSVSVDNNGNVYFAGSYIGIMAFGKDTLKVPEVTGTYLTKYDSNGIAIWTAHSTTGKSGGLYYSNIFTSMDLNKNIYLASSFFDTLIFGIDTLKSNTYPGASIFLAKYDSNGSLSWVKKAPILSSASSGYLNSIATDKLGFTYITGSFIDSITFGSYLLKGGINIGFPNIFLVKYDPNGNVVWAKQYVGSNSTSNNQAYGINYNNKGNLFVTGYFTDTLTLGSSMLTTNTSSFFLAKYDTSGNVIWAKQSISPTKTCNAVGIAVTSDKLGNSYLTGDFIDSVSVGSNLLINRYTYYGGPQGLFTAKYDKNGNVIWAKCPQILDSNEWAVNSITSDTMGNLYLSGGVQEFIYFSGPDYRIKFDSIDFFENSNEGFTYLLKADTSGKILCGSWLSPWDDDNFGVASDPTGTYIYYGEDFSAPIYIGSDTLISVDREELPILARWQPCNNNIITSITPIPKNPSLSLFPNPSSGTFTLSLSHAELVSASQ